MIAGETEHLIEKQLEEQGYDPFIFGSKQQRLARRKKRRAAKAARKKLRVARRHKRRSSPKRIRRREKRRAFFSKIGKAYKDIGGATGIGSAIDSIAGTKTTPTTQQTTPIIAAPPAKKKKPVLLYIGIGVVALGAITMGVIYYQKQQKGAIKK